jgi:ABC-type sugar transport system ATPase subunit
MVFSPTSNEAATSLLNLPDAGEIWFDGEERKINHPGESRALGIEMIYQDLALAGQRDVASNIFVGREPLRKLPGLPVRIIDGPAWNGTLRRSSNVSVHGSARSATGPTGFPDASARSVAIARALTFQPRLVIMDEPTAALAVREVERVLELIRELKRQGITVILISHRLTDVFEVSDRIITLRQGQVIATEAVSETTMTRVVSHNRGGRLARAFSVSGTSRG